MMIGRVISVKHNHQSILACSKILPSLGKLNVVLVSLLENGSQIGLEAKTSVFRVPSEHHEMELVHFYSISSTDFCREAGKAQW